ncbi:MAG: OmpA family protein [Bacteroidetes bacterium]|nr:OmpA family protein [Bacteroidota bacterium]
MNKRILLSVCCLAMAATAFAQKRDGIGISFGANDFYGPQTGNYITDKVYTVNQNLDTGLPDTSVKTTFRWHPLVKFSYWRRYSNHFDGSISLTLGNVDYPTSADDTNYVIRRKLGATKFVQLLAELDARFNYNILTKENYFISPYLFAGISVSHRPGYFGATVPIGAGLNFNLSKSHDLYLNLESAYKIAATSHDQNHLQHSFGFVYWFQPGYARAKPNVAPSVVLPPVSDRDNDGLADNEDACPDIPGPAHLNGCPDSDGDGINDKDDACPLVAGLAQYHGCPDSDGDGIPDNTDKCPYLAGLPQYNGCPAPDRDHDGVPDAEDRCPDQAGPASNQGCPEIKKEVVEKAEKVAKAVFFETGKASIKKVSFKSLDELAKMMKDDASLYADIEGHTDNVQPKSYTNMDLSQKRADAVREYLIKQGVNADHLTAQGFGDTQPVASNDTADGRAKNRRTVIKLRNYAK